MNTKTYLAEHFGVSERTAQVLLNIARNLSKEGNDLLDAGSITQTQAEALSKLPSVKQDAVVNAMREENLTPDEITTLIEATKKAETETQPVSEITRTIKAEPQNKEAKPAKDINGYLKSARNALRKAESAGGEADFKLIGEIKASIRNIEKSLE